MGPKADSRNAPPWLVIGVSVWLAAAAAGMGQLLRFTATPGTAGRVATWPSASSLPRSEVGPTLLLFLHPRCSCSEITLDELEKLLARSRQAPAALIVEFVRPEGAPRDWEQSHLWRRAKALPQATVGVDVDGLEASRFGAETSGQTLLFDRTGRPLFAGGITAGRGHAGDNAGEDAVVALLDSGGAPRASTPVFGCALQTPPVGG